jgi:hypothetical protein
MRNHWETGWIPVPWKHLGSVPQPFGDLAAADLRRKGNPTPTEEETAQAVAKLLVRTSQGPQDRESPEGTCASRRDRRVAARTRAAAESTGPRPPRPPQPATDAEHPCDGEAADGPDNEPIATVIPLGIFDPFKEADKRW